MLRFTETLFSCIVFTGKENTAMLVEFSIENFMSFKDPVTFSMAADEDLDALSDSIIEHTGAERDVLLKSTVLYGANASGKSNFVKALNFLQKLVRTSHRNQADEKIEFRPYRLDANCASKPTTFDVTFIEKSVKYTYSLTFIESRIMKESLFSYEESGKKRIFERDEKRINLADELMETKDEKERLRLEIYTEDILDNVLLLSSLRKKNYDLVKAAFNWFHRFACLPPSIILSDLTADMVDNSDLFKSKVVTALKAADIEICDILVNEEKIPFEELPKTLQKRLLELEEPLKGIPQGADEISIGFDIKTLHQGVDENGKQVLVKFDMEEESEGTQKYFGLLGPILDTLESGRVLIIDELSLHLHPNLSRVIVELFHDPEINTNNAQLIFTTHNALLLDETLFRKDQVWFVEKTPNGTDLFSLADFDDAMAITNIRNAYLQGRYGGVPNIKKGLLKCLQENKEM